MMRRSNAARTAHLIALAAAGNNNTDDRLDDVFSSLLGQRLETVQQLNRFRKALLAV